MMSSVRAFTYWALIWVYWIALIISAILAAANGVTVKGTGVVFEIITWLQGFKPWIALLILITLLSKGALSLLGPSPARRESLQRTLENLQQYLFKGKDGPLHDYRVTIFRYSRWNWKVLTWLAIWRDGRSVHSGWLMPYMRTGHLTLNCRSCWNVPFDGKRIQGVAGQVFSCNQVITIKDLRLLSPSSTNKQLADYAKQVWVTSEWLKSRLEDGSSFARSYCGIPIEINRKPWGAIIIDSKDYQLPDDDPVRFQKTMGLIGQIVGNILKGG